MATCDITCFWYSFSEKHLDRVKRIWYLSPMQTAKVHASLHIRAVSPEPSLLVHTSSESRGTFRQKARSLAPLNGWACAVKFCHDGMLEDTNSLDGAHLILHWNKSNTMGIFLTINIFFLSNKYNFIINWKVYLDKLLNSNNSEKKKKKKIKVCRPVLSTKLILCKVAVNKVVLQ